MNLFCIYAFRTWCRSDKNWESWRNNTALHFNIWRSPRIPNIDCPHEAFVAAVIVLFVLMQCRYAVTIFVLVSWS